MTADFLCARIQQNISLTHFKASPNTCFGGGVSSADGGGGLSVIALFAKESNAYVIGKAAPSVRASCAALPAFSGENGNPFVTS